MAVWSLAEARRSLERLIKSAATDGAQLIRDEEHGTVVVLSVEDYRVLAQSEGRFKDLLASLPISGGSRPD